MIMELADAEPLNYVTIHPRGNLHALGFVSYLEQRFFDVSFNYDEEYLSFLFLNLDYKFFGISMGLNNNSSLKLV